MEESPVVLKDAVSSRDLSGLDDAVAVQVLDASVARNDSSPVIVQHRATDGRERRRGDMRMRGVTPSPDNSAGDLVDFDDAVAELEDEDDDGGATGLAENNDTSLRAAAATDDTKMPPANEEGRADLNAPSRVFRNSSADSSSMMMGDHELVEREPSFRDTGPPAVSIVPGPPNMGGGVDSPTWGSPAGFDVCKEYGYRYEYDDDNNGNSGISPGDAKDGNSDENDEEEEVLNTRHITTDTSGSVAMNPLLKRQDSPPCGTTYLVGNSYHPLTEYAQRRRYESTLMWFTYRSDFTPIRPYGITSDAGWGCMLRSAQMMMCHALRVWLRGKEWTPTPAPARGGLKGGRRTGVDDEFTRDALQWFADFPGAPTSETREGQGGAEEVGKKQRRQKGRRVDGRRCCYYSLHNMVASGLARYEMLPGEWYGPGTACYVLRDLAELHSRHDDKVGHCSEAYGKKPMRVHVAGEGCVYADAVETLMTRDSSSAGEREQRERQEKEDEGKKKPDNPAAVAGGDPLSQSGSRCGSDPLLVEDPLLHPLSDPSNAAHGAPAPPPPPEWDTALLLLLPLRLGLRTFDVTAYGNGLAHVFGLSQSVGFVGGSPRHALWFYGATTGTEGLEGEGADRNCMSNFGEGGDLRWSRRVYGLDPHTVQSAPKLNADGTGTVHLSDAYLRSVHCQYPSSMDLSRIDPSLALGFLCKSRSDFESLRKELSPAVWSKERGLGPPVVSFADRTPDYAADVSSAMAEMMMSAASAGSNPGGDGMDGMSEGSGDGGGAMSDEDEYVML